jgi:ADP-ribose pyrophosphatase
MADDDKQSRIIAKGRYLTLVDDGGWEYVIRPGVAGIVVIVAVTEKEKLVLVEQYRPAVGKRVIELPAGLVGDAEGRRDESMLTAAERELEEETGYRARAMVPLFEGPIAVGLSDENVSFFQATGLSRVGEGGGDDTEDITVHVVPLDDLAAFLAERANAGLGVDPKIHAGLFLAGIAPPRRSSR